MEVGCVVGFVGFVVGVVVLLYSDPAGILSGVLSSVSESILVV